jgi:hypothetical protein
MQRLFGSVLAIELRRRCTQPAGAALRFLSWATVVAAVCLSICADAAAQANSDPQETVGFSFTQRAVPVSRSDRVAVVDVEVSYTYKPTVPANAYPDVRKIVPAMIDFLQSYPDKKGYWELYARDAARKLSMDYAALSTVTVVLTIYPDEARSYIRVATATVTAN